MSADSRSTDVTVGTVKDWMPDAVRRLTEAGVPEPVLDAQLLAAHALGTSRSFVLAHPEAALPSSVSEFLARRERREPLAYITGRREFYGREFAVEPGVLVPRQETECLVEAALDGLGGKVLDIGTGTGCLAVTIKLERPNWMVAAGDVSPVAVRLARRNAEALGATVHVARSDMYEAFADTKFGLVVCNPPYIPRGTELQAEVGLYEPAEALFGGVDGLSFFHRLAVESKGRLMPWGRLIVEIGAGQKDDVVRVFEEEGWVLTATRDDLLGHPRALTFQLS